MNRILNKLRQSEAFNKENKASYIKAVVLMGIFTFVFLGSEYMYVNAVSISVSDSKAVMAQNYALGISALGFLLYPAFCRFCKDKLHTVCTVFITAASVACIFFICRHLSYNVTFALGLLLFLFLGIFGSAAFYKSMCLLENDKYLARLVGISYMIGILLQFVNNNIIRSEVIEAVILSVFLIVLVCLLIKLKLVGENASAAAGDEKVSDNFEGSPKGTTLGLLLVLLVAMMTCIFSTLDNAVTLSHAAGTMDIGQWPRIFLAFSGLIAGFVFDINNRKFMNHIMYCVMILSAICIAVFEFSGPFLTGLIIFYMSAGFFAVFFTASFMELARYTKVPELWAGIGRAANNITAAVITGGSLALLSSGNSIAIITFALILFAAVSIVTGIYTYKHKVFMEEILANDILTVDENERLQMFCEEFS
ncbi:MAG: LuxR family transcriptional regulator, partial [Monoglobaceae bacterium]